MRLSRACPLDLRECQSMLDHQGPLRLAPGRDFAPVFHALAISAPDVTRLIALQQEEDLLEILLQ
jgi:hypothetical protein